MSGGASQHLDSPDDKVVLQGLKSLSHEDSALDDTAVKAVLPKCLDKLQHHDIAIRATAMTTILSILKDDNLKLNKHAETIAKKIQQPNVVDLKADSDKAQHHTTLHKNLCAVITELQLYYPYQLLTSFKPLGLYLINCTAHKDQGISTAACEYWAKLRLPPAPQDIVGAWVMVVMNRLGKLVPALLDCMMYHDKHIQFLEEHEPGDKIPDGMAVYTNKRNFSALGFENLSQIFQGELATTLKPHIEKRLNSENWLETEAMILALGAFTRAVGTTKELREVYPVAIPRLLDLYSHPRPLVRSILCFTMQNFINTRMKNVKDPFPKILRNTLNLLKDDLCEVQEMALQSLAAILAYAERDISPQLPKVTDALVKRNKSIKGLGRFAYFECIGHIFGRAGATMEAEEAEQLLSPLMDQWHNLQWSSADDDSSEVLVRLCQSLCVVAMYYGSGFATYNEAIFSKVVPHLEGAVHSQGAVSDDKNMRHTVAGLDLISALFDGQGNELDSIVQSHKLGRVLVELLKNKDIDEKVHQSVLASLGHLCQHCYDTVKPHFKEVLTMLQRDVNSENAAVQNNALWVLAHVAANHDTASKELINFAKKLRAVISQAPSDNGVAINTSLALTNLARRWPDDLGKVIVKDDVFQPLCHLLQGQFPRDLEKINIFHNVCLVVGPQISKVHKDGWLQFCTAAAVLDCQDEALTRMLRSLLRDVRTHLGNAGWSKLSSQLGTQMSSTLRKRYKLY